VVNGDAVAVALLEPASDDRWHSPGRRHAKATESRTIPLLIAWMAIVG
jgi:hypothetical protein